METQRPPPSCSGRKSSDSSSPEFEFWMVRNPSLQPHLMSADELFVDGVLLPLHLLPQHSEPDAVPKLESKPDPEPEHVSFVAAESNSVSPSVSSSKRWKDIFKMGEKKSSGKEEKEKESKKERKSSSSASGSAAELNINIWPFSRSRSAGTSGRPKASTAARKTSSAPCSRSNSGGESKLKKWPGSPARGSLGGGVHLGRSSPVWQVRRGGSVGKSSEPAPRKSEKTAAKDGAANRRGSGAKSGGVRVLNLNVPMCIGYRQHFSFSSAGDTTVTGAGCHSGNDVAGVTNSNGGGNIFNLRTFFSKKVH